MRPTKIPDTAMRFKNVRVITKMMRAVVQILARLICLDARSQAI
jgi:hypothetical protein